MEFILSNIVEILFLIITTLCIRGYKKFRAYIIKSKSLETTLTELLRIRIIDVYNEIVKNDYISTYDLIKFKSLYEQFVLISETDALLEQMYENIKLMKIDTTIRHEVQL